MGGRKATNPGGAVEADVVVPGEALLGPSLGGEEGPGAGRAGRELNRLRWLEAHFNAPSLPFALQKGAEVDATGTADADKHQGCYSESLHRLWRVEKGFLVEG